jgi:hypothetical protein
MKLNWPYVPGKSDTKVEGPVESKSETPKNGLQELAGDVVKSGQSVLSKVTKTEAMKTESGQAVMEKNWFGRLTDDPHLTSFVKALQSEI